MNKKRIKIHISIIKIENLQIKIVLERAVVVFQ